MNINDKVVCIDDNWSTSHANPSLYFDKLPIKGSTYVVRGLFRCRNGGIAVQLVGIDNCYSVGGFRQSRFTLLEEMKSNSKNKQNKIAPVS